jgi:hypothetical protein
VLKKLELVVKMIDGTDSPALPEPSHGGGDEDHNP